LEQWHDHPRHRASVPVRGPGRDQDHPPRDLSEPNHHHRGPQDVRHPVRVLADGQHWDLALLATSAVILLAPDDEMTYSSFVTAIGIPMTVVLPIIAILSVTGEWSQRSGLTTFTLVPDRGRVIAAKAVSCVGVAVVSIPLAFGTGALGNVVGTAIARVDPVWDLTVTNLLTIVLANVLGLLVGFMLGVVIRSSAGGTRGLLRLLVPAADAVPAPRHLPGLVP
jgi:hypothetical protein